MSITIADLFRDQWEKEHRNTLSVLEAIPADSMDYVPWPGARDMQGLALHIIGVDEHTICGVLAGELVAQSRGERPKPPADLVAFCKSQHEALRPLAAQLDETVLEREVPFKYPDGRVLFVHPGREYLFAHLLHHVIHHRGQLLTYLRLVGAPIPGIYGPTREQMPPMP
jgi:uncharacterized damage-inducible protein DinB